MEALSKEYSDKELRVLMKQNNLLINDYDPKNGRRVGQPACVHAPAAACPCALSCGAPARWRGDREFHASALEPPSVKTRIRARAVGSEVPGQLRCVSR